MTGSKLQLLCAGGGVNPLPPYPGPSPVTGLTLPSLTKPPKLFCVGAGKVPINHWEYELSNRAGPVMVRPSTVKFQSALTLPTSDVPSTGLKTLMLIHSLEGL